MIALALVSAAGLGVVVGYVAGQREHDLTLMLAVTVLFVSAVATVTHLVWH